MLRSALVLASALASILTGAARAQHSVTSIGPGGGTAVQVCTFDPRDPNTLYVGGDCQGVMRTFDGGKTWDAPNRGLLRPEDPFYAAYFVLALEVDPTDSRVVYAGTRNGLYKSSDRAESWARLDLSAAIGDALDPDGPLPVGAIEVDPADGNVIYVGLGDNYDHEMGVGVVLHSSDAGRTWRRIGRRVLPADAIVYGIALDPDGSASSRRLLVSTDRGVFLSEDSGATFRAAHAGLPHRRCRRVVSSRRSDGPTVFYLVLFVTGCDRRSVAGGVYRWIEGTPGWVEANGDSEEEDAAVLLADDVGVGQYNWIAVHPTDPDIVYVASAAMGESELDEGFLWKTTDGGRTWTDVVESFHHGWFVGYQEFDMLALAPSQPDRLAAGLTGPHLSDDGGATWRQAYTDATDEPPRLYSGRNSEMMWTLALALDPRPERADTIYVGYADSVAFKSLDMKRFGKLRAHPVADPVGDLMDGWGPVSDVCPQITVSADDPETVYLSASHELFRSSDGGRTFSRLGDWGDPYDGAEGHEEGSEAFRDGACRFAVDWTSPRDARVLYATVYPRGPRKSTDGGATWIDLSSRIGPDASHLSGVTLDPSDPRRIYLGTYSLLYYSREGEEARHSPYASLDGGRTWRKLAPLPPINRLWVDPQDGLRLLAATLDARPEGNLGGVHLSTDGGSSWRRVLAQPYVSDLAADPHHPDRLYALSTALWERVEGQDAGLWVSEDRGRTWKRLPLELDFYALYPLAIHPSRPDELFVGTGGKGVLRILLNPRGGGR